MNSPSPFPPRPRTESPSRRAAAFTLTEMLGLTVPVLRGFLSGRNISDSLDSVADYLTYARTQAMTQNTYTVSASIRRRAATTC